MDTVDLIQFINELVMLLVRSRAEELFVSLMLVRTQFSGGTEVKPYNCIVSVYYK